MNTGIGFHKAFCLSEIVIRNTINEEKLVIKFDEGINTNKYNLQVRFSAGTERIILNNKQYRYETDITPIKWKDETKPKKYTWIRLRFISQRSGLV